MTEPKATRLTRLLEKKKQIENSIKQLEQRDKEKQRKERASRLIQLGALSEKYFRCAGITPEKYEEFLKRVVEALQNSKRT